LLPLSPHCCCCRFVLFSSPHEERREIKRGKGRKRDKDERLERRSAGKARQSVRVEGRGARRKEEANPQSTRARNNMEKKAEKEKHTKKKAGEEAKKKDKGMLIFSSSTSSCAGAAAAAVKVADQTASASRRKSALMKSFQWPVSRTFFSSQPSVVFMRAKAAVRFCICSLMSLPSTPDTASMV